MDDEAETSEPIRDDSLVSRTQRNLVVRVSLSEPAAISSGIIGSNELLGLRVFAMQNRCPIDQLQPHAEVLHIVCIRARTNKRKKPADVVAVADDVHGGDVKRRVPMYTARNSGSNGLSVWRAAFELCRPSHCLSSRNEQFCTRSRLAGIQEQRSSAYLL